jgi:hypothetical protein
MQSGKVYLGWTVVLAVFTMAALTTGPCAAAQTEKVLHNFSYNSNGKDGNEPQAGLIFDSSGNLYGMTAYGGTGPCSISGSYSGWLLAALTSTALTQTG